jgi:peptidoglycan/LPS O-acetylase OafA/YrhL
MNNWQRNLTALALCVAIVAIAFFLLSYGRSHEVAPILFFGRTLDALVTAGILGNLIIFLLKMTRLNPVKTALWTMLAVHCLLAIAAFMIGSRVDPDFRPGSVLIAYVVSFLFWYGLHWIWEKNNRELVTE